MDNNIQKMPSLDKMTTDILSYKEWVLFHLNFWNSLLMAHIADVLFDEAIDPKNSTGEMIVINQNTGEQRMKLVGERLSDKRAVLANTVQVTEIFAKMAKILEKDGEEKFIAKYTK